MNARPARRATDVRCPPRSPGAARALALAAGLLLPGAACTSVPLAPVPEPLPEALEWQLPASDGAFLGLKTEENDSGSLDALFFEPGARVVHVIENSPAAAAGLQPGDVVLAIAGTEVDDPGALDALVARQPPGTRVDLSVQRGDTVLAVPVTLTGVAGAGSAAPEAPEVLWRADPARSRAGWLTAPDGSGVVLVSLAPGSPCTEAGLVPGDVVTALDGREVHSDRELIRLLQERDPGAEVVLAVRPAGGGAPRSVDVTLQDQPTRLTGVHIPILFHYAAPPDGRSAEVDVIDLWILSLFNYERQEHERTYTFLTLFGWKVFSFSVGEGELGS